MSSDRQIIAPFKELGVAKSNSNVRIFIGSCVIVVCAHAQYEIGKKQPSTTGALSGGLKLQCIRDCHIFYLLLSLPLVWWKQPPDRADNWLIARQTFSFTVLAPVANYLLQDALHLLHFKHTRRTHGTVLQRTHY